MSINDPETSSVGTNDLRQQAEEIARQKAAQSPEHLAALSSEQIRQTFHELRVHQIELEMQNEELRRGQVELDAARARYFDLYDLAPVGYVTLSVPGMILEANLTAATLLGVPRGALAMHPLSHFILREDQDLYYLRQKQLLETGAPQAFDLRLVRKDGTMLWAHLAATAAQDDQGAPVCRIVITDITERKKVEAVQVFLAKTSSGSSAEPFFPALARFLAQSLDMDFVCIDRLEGEGLSARTVAVWCDGRFEDNVTYTLKDTPCGEVVGKDACCFPASVCQFFPRDQVLRDLRAESYVGVTLWSHAGNPIGLIAVISRRPLTNRTQAEATLKMAGLRAAAEMERLDEESVLRFTNVLLSTQQEVSMDGIFVVDENARILSYNRRFIELWGLPAKLVEDQADEPVLAFVTAQLADPQAFLQRVRCLYAHQHETSRDELILADGRTFDRYSAPMFGVGERYYGRVWYFRDITERKQAEQALRQSEVRFRSYFELPLIGICITSPEQGWLEVNPQLCRMLGYTREQLVGMTWAELTHPEDLAADLAQFNRVVAGELEGYAMEKRFLCAGGRVMTADLAVRCVRRADGQVDYFVALVQDITEKKQVEANFLRSQRLEGIGSLAGGIAHDLNNILAPIMMAAPLLRAENGERERNNLLDIVESSAQRGADIIKQLLTFARGRPGARAPIPARLLLNEMGRLIRETFPRNIQLNLTPPANLWRAFGDATQFHQTLMNLCVNARDAMPGGGTLTLGARNVTVDKGFAATALEARPGAYMCVSVADTGTGIAPENLHRIFDPFFTTKGVGKGTGLGLAALLGIMRGHEGFIRVVTQPGSGTTFELYFPALPETGETAAPQLEAPSPRGHGELILLVDDEPALCRVVELALEKYGYRVVTAMEGREALALFASQSTDIRAVITDMMMPGTDGPELVRALRQLNAQLPILGMTGLADLIDTAKLEDLNLAEILNKPFADEKLLAALHRALVRETGPQ